MEYLINDPKTFAVVYAGTKIIVNYDKKDQYFRTNEAAMMFIPFLEDVLMEELEIIKVKKTMRERIMLETRKDSKKSRTRNLKDSAYLNILKKSQEEYKEKHKENKSYQRHLAQLKRLRENPGDYF